jgi:hypothetical protein
MKCEIIGFVEKSIARYKGNILGYDCESLVILPTGEITIPTDFEFFKAAGYKQKVKITVETIEQNADSHFPANELP